MMTKDALTELAEKGLRLLGTSQLDEGVPAGDDAGPNVRWHQVALEGEWDGHYQGPFKLDARDFEQMSFHRRALGIDTVVDYKHSSLNPFVERSPAAGWIDDLDVRQTDQGLGLFARVKWTESAAKAIREREYRYLSPTILWRTKDRKTGVDLGTSLHSVALTNTPFLDELPDLRLNSFLAAALGNDSEREDPPMNPEKMTALSAVLGLNADADFDAILAQVRGLQDEAGGLEKVCAALGLEGASVAAMSVTATALREEIDVLRPKAEAADKLRVELAIKDARGEGKVDATNEAWVSKLAAENPAEFSEWVKIAPKLVPLTAVKRKGGQSDTVTLDPNEPTDAAIDRLCKMSEIAAEASRSGVALKTFVKSNFASLTSQYA